MHIHPSEPRKFGRGVDAEILLEGAPHLIHDVGPPRPRNGIERDRSGARVAH